jgi:hypothetical protein
VVVTRLIDRLGTFVSVPVNTRVKYTLPFPAFGRRRGDFRFRFLLRYDIIKKFEQIFQILQFPIIFLVEAFELRGILVADSPVEFC